MKGRRLRRNSSFSLLRWLGIGLIILASFLLVVQLVKYSRIRARFPTGMLIADIPVGELDYTEASERLLTAYLSPIEVQYQDAVIQVRPASLGFDLQLESMLAAADRQRTTYPFWAGFWNFLWNRTQQIQNIPLQARFDEAIIREYLENEVAARYDQPATPPLPIPGEAGFYAGVPGTQLDVERSTQQVTRALVSATNRSVALVINRSANTKPPIGLLEVMLRDIVDASAFEGLVEIYLQDLNTNQTLSFVHGKNIEEEIATNIAFSSWSTIKIPVMVTAFRLIEEPYDPETLDLIKKMIELSDNESTDELAAEVIDDRLAPLIVTDDLQTLGLKNTFWAGFFYPGAPLLQLFDTMANQRTDISTEPDIYNQTTPMEMGLLLQDIYHCAEAGGGSLIAAFYGEITQRECQLMVEYLGDNKIGVLLQAGVPAGTTVAHKHGWAYETDDGYIHTIGDVAIIYTPGGDYIFSIFAYDEVQAVFDPVNLLFANLSTGAYNYFNLKQ